MKKTIPLLLLLITINSFSQETKTPEDNTIYNIAAVKQKPEFPGGLKQFNSMVNENYQKAGFSPSKKAKVNALFVVEKDGSLSDVKIIRYTDADKAKELVRILESLPKWTPGKQKGTPVRTLYAITLVIGG